jgi:hypothetical protein
MGREFSHILRVSEISATEDFAVELRREELRDRRWCRHRSMLRTWGTLVALVVLANSPSLVSVLVKLI